MKTNQKIKIINYIKEFGSINPLEALQDLGCYRLATRIFELKAEGYEIKTYLKKYETRMGEKKHYAVYYLANTDFARIIEG